MSKNLIALTNDALRMSDLDRGELATRLLDSLDPGADENLDEAWTREFASRLDEIRLGHITPIPWSEARRQILDDGGHAD